MSSEGVVRICTKCNKEVEKGIPFLNVPGGVCHQSCFSIGTCHGCSKELLAAEQIMEALNKKYHVSCFKCKMCQTPLQGSFVNYNEEPHCKTCIESLKAKQAQAVRGECGICSQGIVASARAISFNNKIYHADCFVCYNCKGPFSGGVAEVNNNFYCPPCVQLKKEELQKQQQQYQQTVSQLQQNNNQQNQQPGVLVCASCNQQIVSGKVVNVLGRTWHLDCLKCVVCSKSLSDGKLGNVNNQPHCVPCAQNAQQNLVNQQQQQQQALEEQHNKLEQQRRELSKQWDEFQAKASGATETTIYDTVDCSVCMTKIKGEYQELAGQVYCNDCATLVQRALQCDVCRKVISGGVSFRKALGKTFHKECFKCAHCKVVIEGKKFKANEGKIYCDNDYTALFGVFKENCPKCDKVINQGEVLTHNEISYHSACFLCTHCNSPFVGGQYMPGKSGQLYCRECFLQGHFL